MGSDQSKAEERRPTQLDTYLEDYLERNQRYVHVQQPRTYVQPAPNTYGGSYYDGSTHHLVNQPTYTHVPVASPTAPPPPVHTNTNASPYGYATAPVANHQGPNLYPNLNFNERSADVQSPPSTSSADVQSYGFVNGPHRNTRPTATQPNTRRPNATQQASNTNRNIRRDMSVSSQVSRSTSQVSDDEDDDLNCLTCGDKYGITIYQCSSGHSSCKLCREQGASCGACGNPITGMRNITLEQYVAERRIPCTNASQGCRLSIKVSDMEFHVRECPFSEMACPVGTLFGRCTYRGKAAQLRAHFDRQHPDNRQGNIDTEMFLFNIFDQSNTFHLVNMGNYNFIFYVKVDTTTNKIYMTVQLIGTKVSASRWTYEVHIYNKGQPRRKFLFTDICNSSGESIEDIFSESRCVAIPLSYASTFLNQNYVNYKFYIKKAERANNGPNRNNRNRRYGRGGNRNESATANA